MNSYNCNLKRDRIQDAIYEYVGDTAEIKIKSVGQRTTYSIQFRDGRTKSALLLVHYNNDGTTTLNFSSGKNQEYSLKLADFVKDKTAIPLYDVGNLYFKSISSDSVETINDQFKNYGYSIEPKTVANGIQYHVSSNTGEAIYYTHYNNSSILFQGKPSMLFNQTIEILLDTFPHNEVVQETLGYYRINIPKEEFELELSTRYTNLSDNLDVKLKATLLPSIALRRIVFDNLGDYSYIAYPALKTLEGLIKHIYLKHRIIIDKGFEGYFKFNHTSQKWEAGDQTTETIKEVNTINKLTNLYTTYYNIRHSLFHYEILTPITKTKEEAFEIVDQVLDILNNNC